MTVSRGPRLAIDVGATTLTARVRGGFGARSTVLFDGAAATSSAVCFEGRGACAGEDAVAAGAGDPSSYAGSPLSAILDGRLRYGGVDRDPAELLMPVLSLVLAHAREIDAEPPESISCIVPLGSMDRLRGPMAMAASSLGLPEPSLVPEPVAAVLHATGGRGLAPGTTGVIVDAGGSSMEVTVLRGTCSGAPEILADAVDRSLGGDAVDAAILSWLGGVVDRDNPPLAAALRAETNRTLMASLRSSVRRAKEDLARVPESEIVVTTVRGHGTVRLTRADLNAILARWSAGARGLLTRALRDAGLPADGTVGCFVIGGGASLPTLGPALASIGRLTIAHDPLTAAADGALLADDDVLRAIAGMDEAPARPAPARAPAPSSPFLPRTAPSAAGVSGVPGARALPTGFRRIWPGATHVVAEDEGGRLWQWGTFPLVTLTGKPMAPHPVAGAPTDVVAASSGESFSIVVDSRGGAAAWGSNVSNQLGQRQSPVPRDAVVMPSLPSTITDVSCGGSHVLAITGDGRVLSWGTALGGRLGTVAPMDLAPRPPTPLAPNVADIIAVAAGTNHSLALDDGGGLWGWGRDHRGQLGGAPGRGSAYPMRLPTAVPFTAIAAGRDVTLAIDADGTVWAWGRNDRGQLGLGSPPSRSAAGRLPLPGPAVRVFAGGNHAGAVLADGRLFAWGANDHGQLGVPGGPRSMSPIPRQLHLPGDRSVVDAGGGDASVTCLTGGGEIVSWGGGMYGIDGSGSRSAGGPEPRALSG